jgi:hypothetical protein
MMFVRALLAKLVHRAAELRDGRTDVAQRSEPAPLGLFLEIGKLGADGRQIPVEIGVQTSQRVLYFFAQGGDAAFEIALGSAEQQIAHLIDDIRRAGRVSAVCAGKDALDRVFRGGVAADRSVSRRRRVSGLAGGQYGIAICS